jgi:BirA family biotin operon repressor/biotin-[acetyl-CoA-carboxylase] ligase
VYITQQIEAALHAAGFKGGLHFQAVTGSTNTDAREAALQGAPHGSVWLAEEQAAGRGRSDHRWESAAGKGLYLSILLRPSLAADHLQWLPLATGLAARSAIHALTPLTVDLRWPNDLLIGPRKVGGILVESKLKANAASSAVEFAVVGIGINVHQVDFPDGLEATSLDLELARFSTQQSASMPAPVHRQQLLVEFLKKFAEEWELLQRKAGRSALPRRLSQASTWIQGREVQVHGPQACMGVTAGVDANGMLLIATGDGVRTITTGGIRAVGNATQGRC